MNTYTYGLDNPLYYIDIDGLVTRPVTPGPVRGPDRGASEGGACDVRRTGPNGTNYPHAGVDLLHTAGGSVVAPEAGAVSISGDGITICRTAGTQCCGGSNKPKLVCWRLVHIRPSVTSGNVSEGQTVGTVLPQGNANIPPHVHVEYYEYTCEGRQRRCPTPLLP
jgi:murein DD-endopeptidase MepM/ murein hydrolase activator NlpD